MWLRRRGVRARREATAELRQVLDLEEQQLDGCAGQHDGPCDGVWGRCGGMSLGFEERRYAGHDLWERGWAA